MSNRIAPYERVMWTEFRNVSPEEVPPFGVVRITGTVTAGPGRLLLEGDKPDAYGSQWSHYINGRLPVPAGKDGLCAVPTGPILARLAPDSPIEFGTPCGPLPDSWLLHPQVGGFEYLGNAGGNRVLVTRVPLLELRISLNEDLESGETADATPYYWGGSEWVASEEHVTVREFMGLNEELPENTICTARWIPNAGFCVIAAGCN